VRLTSEQGEAPRHDVSEMGEYSKVETLQENMGAHHRPPLSKQNRGVEPARGEPKEAGAAELVSEAGGGDCRGTRIW